ncbi:hypothetical protein SAMN05421734_11512 [Pelagirhabdus alkalitolerans]|uniref:Lmo0937 family membrane protein n=1 Tax=Pelagirhabdus alkalitolerans TaxID=1612202 RepID=A0A1G6N917_9BACI|nr:lmo0937 family membrane protein [Pelagirhabdus alkalitolerans]SDC64350.1 hypothetical protein SAMN05421734_11512 [Pelagirhabdus alkalitolerans]
MLWTIIGIILLAWLVGLLFDVGSLIHALLIVALLVFIARLIRGR